MLGFALRRVLWTLPILLLVVTATFFLMRSIGGSPLRKGPLVGLSNVGWVKYGDVQPEAIERAQIHRDGLDRPWYRQYLSYVEGVARFDFGPSLTFRYRSVNEIVKQQASLSLELGALAFGWALVAGVALGVVAALGAGGPADYAARLASSAGLAVPNFLVGTVLIYVFAVRLGWLPTSGWEGWRSRVLPALALGLLPAAWFFRLMRGSVLEALASDYVRTARAKGLPARRIVTAHVLRNSLLPLLTAAGPMLGYLLAGSFVIEQVFSIPGIGRYFVAGVFARDYPLVMALTIMLAAFIVVANAVVDVLVALLDPRVREATA
jgi:oligopeptide transport system permease protein